MSKEQNVKIAMSFIEGFNARNMSQWAGLLADNFTAEYPGAPMLNSTQARQFNEAFLPAFPDLHFEADRVLTDGDFVVIHWTAGGTHNGPLMTASGQTIPPTHQKGVVVSVLISEIKGGKIVREQTYWDQMALLSQLGLIPAA